MGRVESASFVDKAILLPLLLVFFIHLNISCRLTCSMLIELLHFLITKWVWKNAVQYLVATILLYDILIYFSRSWYKNPVHTKLEFMGLFKI